jgi:GNAT superfamily N-acetyltransferase
MAQSRAIGLDTEGVASTFYPGDMAEIRRKTTPPAGCFLVAREDDAYVGSASFRPLAPGACEMHDVWVPPAERGRGIGARLVARLVEEARDSGYGVMRPEFAAITIWMERPLVVALPG